MVWQRDRRLDELGLGWARAENVRGAEVYVRPARGYAWPVVLLDDVAEPRARKIARRYDALVVRTSPAGGCHVWLACARALDEAARAQAQRGLVARVGADRGSVSGEHLGRLAGCRNWKRGGVWVNVLDATAAGRRWDPCAGGVVAGPPPVVPWAPGATARRGTGRDGSPSGRDWGWVCQALTTGGDPEVVRAELARRAAARRGVDAPRYAARTVLRAVAHLAGSGEGRAVTM
jgi:hypothetical protein